MKGHAFRFRLAAVSVGGMLWASLASAAPAPAATPTPDPWVALVGADRATVEKAVGRPNLEFTALLDDGAQPLQLTPGGAPPAFDADEKLPPRSAVRVLQYDGGERGMDYQVVLKGQTVLWAVVPPAPDELNTASVRRKYGKPIVAKGDVYHADILRHWEVLAYPKKGLAFVRRPGDNEIVARVLRTPSARKQK